VDHASVWQSRNQRLELHQKIDQLRETEVLQLSSTIKELIELLRKDKTA
jgi:hypothetical protein